MARFIFAFMVFAMAIAIIKMLLVAIILAGLIFRPKETLGVLFGLGVLALFSAFPAPSLVLGGIIVTIALYKWARSKPADEAEIIDGQLANELLPAPDRPTD